jgi:hypothetical protein
MNFKRRIFLYSAVGTGICVAAQAGLIFCFFTYKITGEGVGLLFFWLANWPNMLFQPSFPKTLPGWLDGLGWPINCFISLVGWVTSFVLLGATVHGIMFMYRRSKV